MKPLLLSASLLLIFSGCVSKPLPPTTATYHDGKRSMTIVVPHDPKPNPIVALLEAVAGPLLTLFWP